MPRVRQLEVPALLDGIDLIVDSPKEVQGETLLALDSDSEEELVPNIIGGTIKYWLSPGGGLGCFATDFRDVLAEVAKLTGTRISVIDDRKGIQISGKSSDVDDAFAKLTGLEKPLVSVDCHCLGDMASPFRAVEYSFSLGTYSKSSIRESCFYPRRCPPPNKELWQSK